MQYRLAIFLASLFLFNNAMTAAEAADVADPRFMAVQKYIMNGDDYPEVFNGKEYRLKVEGIAIGDLDMDGEAEVVLQVKPHYLQSPTIIIYRVDKNMNVTRIIEGLAPGPLQPFSGDYIDSHTLGLGVDFAVQFKDKNVMQKNELVALAMKDFGGVVQYDGWFHADNRAGYKIYIDMSHVKTPHDQHNCMNFEFSTVEYIQIMAKKAENRNYLLVSVGDSIYQYKINKFLDNGLIDKEMEILKKE